MGLALYSIFFFKQKTAYEMRISDWSSDVCSSDLATVEELMGPVQGPDFPTGGIIVESARGIREAYTTGRGSMRVRARWHVEDQRSEEHTSELQSLMRISYAVFCLKKKKKTNNNIIIKKQTTSNNIHESIIY